MHDLILVRNIVDGQHLNEKGLNFNVFYLSDDNNLIEKTRLASKFAPQNATKQ